MQIDRCMKVQFIKTMMATGRGTSRDSIQCDVSLAASIAFYQNPPRVLKGGYSDVPSSELVGCWRVFSSSLVGIRSYCTVDSSLDKSKFSMGKW